METILSILILGLIVGFMLWKIITTLRLQRLEFSKPKGIKEWHDIKYGNGFIVLHWSELKRWESSSVKEKTVLINHQQSLIKSGVIKIVREGDERRLVMASKLKKSK